MANEIVTETHGRVRLITLNRPEARNAVNSALGLALVAAIEELDSDDGSRRACSPARAGLQRGHGPQGLRQRGSAQGLQPVSS